MFLSLNLYQNFSLPHSDIGSIQAISSCSVYNCIVYTHAVMIQLPMLIRGGSYPALPLQPIKFALAQILHSSVYSIFFRRKYFCLSLTIMPLKCFQLLRVILCLQLPHKKRVFFASCQPITIEEEVSRPIRGKK